MLSRIRPSSFQIRLAGAVVAGLLNGAALADEWDLKSDWSDSSNPNGVWSYRATDGSLLSSGSHSGALPTVTQPAWGPGNPMSIFKSNGTETVGHDWLLGDIVTHTAGLQGGGGAPQPMVRWTSPLDGVIDVMGEIWWGGVADQFFRADTWSIAINGIIVTNGEVGSGSGHTRANPFHFENGSGGASALDDISVHTGDTIDLTIRTQANSFMGNGGYAAFNMTICTVPSPPASVLGLCAAGFTLLRRRSV